MKHLIITLSLTAFLTGCGMFNMHDHDKGDHTNIHIKSSNKSQVHIKSNGTSQVHIKDGGGKGGKGKGKKKGD